MSEDERAVAGTDRCPRTSSTRSIWPEGSKVLRDALGDHVHEFLMRNKRVEWDAFRCYVTPYELERYLPIL
jgi:glutamine synthetase